MTGTAPGWYRDDPELPRTLRWYDGARWTQHTRDAAAPDVPPGPGPHPPAWTPAYGPPGSYPPPPRPAPSPDRPPLPRAGPRPEDTQRQALVALGVISALLLGAIVVVIALLATYDGPEDATIRDRGNAAPRSADPGPPPAAPTPADPPSAAPAADTPEAVAEAFVTALLDGRCEEAVGYFADGLDSATSACAEVPVPEGLGGLVDPQVGAARVDGDTARVPVGFAPRGSGQPVPGTRLVLEMVRQDDEWKIRDLTLR